MKEKYEIKIDKNTDDEFLNVLSKSPYTSVQEISELFSHLLHIDEIQREKSLHDKILSNKYIKFDLNFIDETGNEQSEKLKIPLGYGHFSKGITHLREVGKEELDKESKIDKNLEEKFNKFLKLPPEISIEKLKHLGWNTLEACAKILETTPSPELSNTIKGFMEGIEGYKRNLINPKKDQKQEKTETQESISKDNKVVKKEILKEDQEAIKNMQNNVREAAKSLKKNNNTSPEIKNPENNRQIQINR